MERYKVVAAVEGVEVVVPETDRPVEPWVDVDSARRFTRPFRLPQQPRPVAVIDVSAEVVS